jgi:hypothetical protein
MVPPLECAGAEVPSHSGFHLHGPRPTTARGFAILGYSRNALADTAREFAKTSPAPDGHKTWMQPAFPL